MPERPIDLNLTRGTEVTVADAPKVDMGALKAKIARVLQRGIAVDRLQVDLPKHLHGEWVSNDPVSIARMQLLGYEIDTEYATKRTLNDQADGKAVMGDVTFMVCPIEAKMVYDEIRRENYAKTHLQARQKEEKEFEANNKSIGMPATVNSQTNAVDGITIEQTIKGE